MSGPNSVRTELAAAFRVVAAAYRQLPEERRPEVRWNAQDDLIELALGTQDRDLALAAISAWKTHWLSIFSEAKAGR